MSTTTVRIKHPVAVRGRSRAYWIAGHVARVVLNLACLAALAWVVSRPSLNDLPGAYLLLALAAALAGRWAVRRFGWLAWAEVPGAWRTYTSAEEAAAAKPDRRADQWLSVLHNAVTVVGGLYIVQLPGQAPSALVGLLGGGMVVLFGARLGRSLADGSFVRNREAIVGGLVAAAPAFTWAGVGDASWARYGMLTTLILLVMSGLLRYGIRGVR